MGRAMVLAAVLGLHLAACVGGELDRAAPDALRDRAQQAFAAGDYEAMAAAYGQLAAWLAAEADAAAGDARRLAALVVQHFDDAVGLGHAWQLAGDWARAVSGYQNALSLVDAALRAGVAPIGEPGDGLRRRRSFLITMIGRIQREELKDPRAALATLARGIELSPTLNRPIAEVARDYEKRIDRILAEGRLPLERDIQSELHYPLQTLAELAKAQEDLGQFDAALEAWHRAKLGFLLQDSSGGGAGVAHLGELLDRLPAGYPLERVPMLTVLSPGTPAARFDMDDRRTLARSYRPYVTETLSYWHYVLAPPPGQEFAALVFTCDIEQLDPRFGGNVTCCSMPPGQRGRLFHIGSVGWGGGQPGRGIVTRDLDVPPGAGMIDLEIGAEARGKFKTHSVAVRAEFRPRQAAQPLQWAGIQTAVEQPRGFLTRNGEAIEPDTAYLGMTPGHYSFRYVLADGTDEFRCEADLAPGARYGLFINLDSPFRWETTPLRGFSQFPPVRASLGRLADGRWLVAYTTGSRILLSARDAAGKWEEPWEPLPAPSVTSIAPCLHVDRRGVVWLAFFNDRLRSESAGTAGYQLWLASSRDGRAWSRPRPVILELPEGHHRTLWCDYERVGGWPVGGIHMTEGPDGRSWMFWREYAGSAESLADLRQLSPLKLGERGRPHVWNPHVVIHASGRLHMVFDDFGQGIWYTTSKDGRDWSPPVVLPVQPPGRASQPQLVLDGDEAVLIYEGSKGAMLCRGRLTPEPRFRAPVRITNYLVPVNGSRMGVAPDGETTLLVGQDTVWLLRADLKRLVGPVREF